jgi:uncharacterized protein with beta-barrel porin domain
MTIVSAGVRDPHRGRGGEGLRAVLCGIAAAAAALTLAPPSADAACSGSPVVCDGNTVNQDNPDGFGTGQDNLTITVTPGASVTGDDDGFRLGTGNTINNSGAVTGTTDTGIQAGGDITVNNASGATITGDMNGILASGTAAVTNYGSITGIEAAIATGIYADAANVTNYGTIAGGLTGIYGNTSATVFNYGTISGANSGSGIQTGDANITNYGLIQVTGPIAGTAVDIATGVVTNYGTVSTTGAFAYSILVRSNATINNSGTISSDGDSAFTIFGSGTNLTVNNSGTIAANGSGSAAVVAPSGTLTLTNTGTISAIGNGGNGIIVVNPAATLTLINSGTISVSGYGVYFGSNSSVTNNGSITAGGGIVGNNDNTVINNGTISVVGQYGVGIHLLDNTSVPALPNVINSGIISSLADDATGISVGANQFVLNSGMISVGTGGVGVDIAGNNSVLNNFGTIRATGGGSSIQACTCGPANDTFNNMAGATLDGRMTVNGQDNTVNNAGLITIIDAATPIAAQSFNIANGNGNANTNPNIFSQSASGTLALRMDNSGAVDGLVADAVNPGGTLRIAIQSQLYANTLISSAAAVTANYFPITHSFDTYTSTSPFFTVTPLYDSGDPSAYSQLYIQLNRIAFNAIPGLTPNQQAVGNALEHGYSTSLRGNAASFYENLFTAGSAGAYDQLSGAGTAAAQDASFSAASLFNNAMMQQGLAWLMGAQGGANSITVGAPLGYAAAPRAQRKAGQDAFAAMEPHVAEPARWHAWTAAFGGTRSTDGDASLGTADQSTRTAGGAAGVDHQIGDLLLGVAAGGSSSHFSVPSLSTSGTIDGGHVGAYAVKTFGAVYAAATLNYAHFSNKTDRTISGVGTAENASGTFGSDQLGGRFELGWRKPLEHFTLTPFAAIEPAALWQHAYTETSTTTSGGSGMLGLSYSAHTATSLPTFLGAQIDTRYVLAGGQVLSPLARLSWVHEFKPDRQVEASFISIPSTLFTVDGARAARDSVRLDTGMTLTLNQSVALFASFNGEFSGDSQMASATGGAKITW